MSSKRPDGRGSYCKECFNVRSKASYAKKVKERHGREVVPPRVVPDGHRYCPDCESVKPLTDFPRNRSGRGGHGRYCKPCHNVRGVEGKKRLYGGTREYHLRHRYGIGQAEFDALLAEQGGVCAICGAADPEHVDHDHRTGYVRGILCFNCNGGLGQFRDNPAYLAQAITYLKGTTWQRVLIHPGVYRISSPTRGRLPSRSS
ncbi:endonuclease VII domain-containing protein [Actinoplanes sp. RD1]|uniref:endonuclease VII domain-containing protein n=1 Tax=Actinoplanes sp. RD1 TaxID=3064538 RepID=UPI002741169E|nr:endonuclease VII domain-containing protein [Actinoplanes sp. RD1]